MELKGLRERCEAKLAELNLSAFENAHSFCAALAARRARPIVLQAVANPAGPFGLWVGGRTADVIFYERNTSPLHQEHIILHEACHLVWQHRPAPVTEGELAHLLFPDVQPEVIQRVLRRAGYSTAEEQEAEMLASLILERYAGAPSPSTPPDAKTARLVDRLTTALGDGQ